MQGNNFPDLDHFNVFLHNQVTTKHSLFDFDLTDGF